MTVLPIVTVGDPVLRKRCAELAPDELETDRVQTLIEDLIETRRAAGGAGLAAPQVGEPARIAVVEVDAATRYDYKPYVPLTVLVNPWIEPLSDEQLVINEGCLSVPDLRADVPRWLRIRVRFLDRAGEPQSLTAEGLTAGTFQHEVDHLDGIMFLDRVEDPRSFATWKQFDRHGREAFLQRVSPWVRGAAQ